MKKLIYLIVLALILGLVLTGCLLSNVGQVPATDQSAISYLTKGLPFSDGLVGLWSFEEGEDPITAYDSSGNNNDGTIHEAIYIPDQWGGQALSFDGMNSYVEVPVISITDELTVEAWVYYVQGQPETDYGGIICNVDGRGNRNRLLLHGAKTVLWQTIISGTTNNHFFTLPGDQRNAWHHYALTYDGTKVMLFWDGLPVGTGQLITGDLDSGTVKPTIGWGSIYTNYYHLNGLIDEVRIYDYALSPGTIEAHAAGIYGFNGLLAPYAPPEQKAFKAGSTIPLKWQYTDSAGPVDSANAEPVIGWIFMGPPVNGSDILEEEDAPGASGLRYDDLTMTWQFNWQTTKSFTAGQYDIYIKSNQTDQTDGPFPIQLK